VSLYTVSLSTVNGLSRVTKLTTSKGAGTADSISKFSNRSITFASNRTADSNSNRISKLRRSLHLTLHTSYSSLLIEHLEPAVWYETQPDGRTTLGPNQRWKVDEVTLRTVIHLVSRIPVSDSFLYRELFDARRRLCNRRRCSRRCRFVGTVVAEYKYACRGPVQQQCSIRYMFNIYQGSHSFSDKKSRTFQDPHEKFSRTFSEPTDA